MFGPLRIARTRTVWAGSTSTEYAVYVLTWTFTATLTRPTRLSDKPSHHALGSM